MSDTFARLRASVSKASLMNHTEEKSLASPVSGSGSGEASHNVDDTPPSYISPTETTGSGFGRSRGRFIVATKDDSLSSGFPFDERLYEYGITHDQWHLFTNEIVEAAKITFAEDVAAWSAGVAVGVVSSIGLLVFAPIAGYYAARPFHRKAVINHVKKELMHQGQVRTILRKWNEHTFKQKGFHAWLELPKFSGEVTSDVAALEERQLSKKLDSKIQKARKIEDRRFKIVILPGSTGFLQSSNSNLSLTELPPRNPATPIVPFAEAPEDKAIGELPSKSLTIVSPSQELPTEISNSLRSSQAIPMELDSQPISVKY